MADIDIEYDRKTYARFTAMLKYGAIACFIIAFIVILLIS